MKLDARPLTIALFVAAPLPAACGDGETPVNVYLAFDADTCGSSDPGDLALTCGATVGMWLIEGGSERIVDHECVDLDGPGTYNLGQLQSLVDGMDIAGPSDTRAHVQVAVYTPWSAEDGCLPPDQIVVLPTLAPSVVVRGGTETTRLSDTDDFQDVALSCRSARSDAAETCQAGCDDGHQRCMSALNIDGCLDEQEACLELCTDELCMIACNGEYEDCQSQTADGRCRLDYEQCLSGCQSDGPECVDDCGDSYSACLEVECAVQQESCSLACPVPECAAFPG